MRAAKEYADPDRYVTLKVRSARERVFGTPLTVKGNRDNSPALDRVDNAKGYVKGNVAIISQRANACKRDMTVDECRKLLAYMEAHELSS